MSVFVQAHQDDWQGNMGSRAYMDLKSIEDGKPGRVLFIYLTAGDAENGDAFWQARERGARASVRHLLQNVEPLYTHTETPKPGIYHGHQVDAVVIGNVTSVFMRLPDFVNGPSAFQRLQNGERVSALGIPSATYANWNDLLDTVVEVVEAEGLEPYNTMWFNAIEEGSTSGHPDHTWTPQTWAARIVKEIIQRVSRKHPEKTVSTAWFQGSGRIVTEADGHVARRMAALLPYESEMLKFNPTGSSCTLSEPLVVDRRLLLQEIRA